MQQAVGRDQARAQAVLVEAVAAPCAAEPGPALALQGIHPALGLDGGQVEHRVAVLDARVDLAVIDGAHRVQRHHHGLLPRQGLQAVEQVVQADAGPVFSGIGGAFVVPGGPGRRAARQHAGIGVQHGLVGLVADGAQHAALERRGIGAQQAQGLVAVAGQHHGVEPLRAVRHLQQHAVRGAA